MKLAILVSGRGSNLAAVLDAIADGLLPMRAAVVVSNRAGVPALEVARSRGVPVQVLLRSEFADAGARDGAVGRTLAAAGADLALLAGYDQLLRAPYFEAFAGRTINVHPSLLPRHGGRGMTGLAVHASVLAAGDRETGVTVHEVTPQLDAGPALAQVRVTVRPGESVEQLAQRVLAVEHRVVVDTLARLAAEPGPGGPSASMTAAPTASGGSGAKSERSASDA